MRLINWKNYNYKTLPDVVEINTLPSMTVPDMSLSLRDLVERHKKGLNVKTFSPVYSEKNVGLEKLDKIERAELVTKLADFVSTSRGRLLTGRAAALKAAQDAAVIAEHERKMKVKEEEIKPVKPVKPINEGSTT